MAQYSKAFVDSQIRTEVFSLLNIADNPDFVKINDRHMGILVTDANGVQRYARVAVIVAEEREDMSAEELMKQEINKYEGAQARKAERAAAAAEKAAKDKEKREKAAAAKAAKAASEDGDA